MKIKEIFESIQGEGPYIGYKQVFVRFCNCNLKCNYCDTEFSSEEYFEDFTPQELAQYISKFENFHSISLTGGEPLLSVDFLKDFLPLISKYKIYLETNATLADKLVEIVDFVDIIAADIKLESATGLKDTMKFHEKFFEIANKKECFAKVVFNKNITDEEIDNCCSIAAKYGIELILQPEMRENTIIDIEFAQNVLDKFLMKYQKVRLIPQVHKFLNIR